MLVRTGEGDGGMRCEHESDVLRLVAERTGRTGVEVERTEVVSFDEQLPLAGLALQPVDTARQRP